MLERNDDRYVVGSTRISIVDSLRTCACVSVFVQPHETWLKATWKRQKVQL